MIPIASPIPRWQGEDISLGLHNYLPVMCRVLPTSHVINDLTIIGSLYHY